MPVTPSLTAPTIARPASQRRALRTPEPGTVRRHAPAPRTSQASAPGGAALGLAAALRGDVGRRRRVDRGLAGGLREWLEDGVAPAVAGLPPGDPAVVVDRRALAGVPEPPTTGRTVTRPLARGAMTGVLFRQLVACGSVGDPVVDALDVLAADGHGADIASHVAGLDPQERASLEREVRADAATMASQWPAIPCSWLPRTGDRMAVPLAGGRVVLLGIGDLVLGAPPADRESVCVVELRTGGPSAGDRLGRCLLGLLETLRSGAPPFRVATYYPATGDLVSEEVRDVDLAATVHEVIACAIRRCDRRAAA